MNYVPSGWVPFSGLTRIAALLWSVLAIGVAVGFGLRRRGPRGAEAHGVHADSDPLARS